MPDELTRKEKLQYAVNAARRDLVDFCLAVDPKYTAPWHVELIAAKLTEALERAIRNEKTRIILELPPRHGKSELATKYFPAWALGLYADIPVIVASYNSEIATKFGLKTRDVMRSDAYRAIFPTRLRSDQKAKGHWLVAVEDAEGRQTFPGGGYTATGIGGGITGSGFKIGIIDDPFKDREEAESELVREKVWDWYRDVFYTRQESNAAIVVIAARWHMDDLIGRLKDKEEEDRKAGVENYDQWEVIRFPAIAEEDEEFRKAGEPLWPEKFTIEQLRNIENTQGIYGFSALYQQDPISSATREFQEEHFKKYQEHELRLVPNLKYKTLVDLAHRKSKRNHETVIRTVAKAPELPHFYCVDEAAGHFDPGQTLDHIFHQQRTYGSEVWIEGVGYQNALEFFAKERMQREQYYFIVHLLKRNDETSKEERIRGLIPFARAGSILVRADGMDAGLVRQAVQFPNGKLDDRIDCLANMLEAFEATTAPRHRRARKIHRPLSAFGG